MYSIRGVARRKIRGFLKTMNMSPRCTRIVVSWTHCTIIESFSIALNVTLLANNVAGLKI